ncbi:MAG: hypothetical protein U5N86_00665 [Planctomycetota bacterium]|nr:hypothetical protein [Planctomycetota bacterium]
MSFDVWNANIEPNTVLENARKGMLDYFARNTAKDLARIDAEVAAGALSPAQGETERSRALEQAHSTERTVQEAVLPALEEWLTDEHVRRICPAAISAIADAVDDKRWEHLYEAFFSNIKFGTGGIRGRAVMSVGDLRTMAAYGVDSVFLRGPNLFSDLTVLRLSSAVAKYAAENDLKAAVLGFDSRIGGPRFASLIARLFRHKGLKVYMFDKPCPFPELSYSVVHFGADLGIFISASHNDKRYNGYKLTSSTGAQLTNAEREDIFENYVKKASFADVPELPPLEQLADKLTTIGDKPAVEGADSFDLDPLYLKHMKKFIVSPQRCSKEAKSLKVGFCAYYGAGSGLVPRLLDSAGFKEITQVTYKSMDKPDGFFPCFSYTQQPDPGDPSSAKIAVDAFKAEHGEQAFDELDILIGLDPDADRMGVVVKVPHEQREVYGSDWTLLKADQVWALLLWYRMQALSQTEEGRKIIERGFIAQSHVTSDLIVETAKSYGLSCLKTWVGFSLLAEAVSFAWNGEDIFDADEYMSKYFTTIYGHEDYEPGVRDINLGCFEESNGFSILGGPPSEDEPDSLGKNGHVRDKDGTLAALLIAEVAAYAKTEGKGVLELTDELSLREGVGFYVNKYSPDPPVGQYEGVNAIAQKLYHLHKAEELRAEASRGELVLGPYKVVGTQICPGKGKYAADPDHGYKPHKTMDEAVERSTTYLPDTGDEQSIKGFVGEMVQRGMDEPGGNLMEQYSAARSYFFSNVAVFPEEGVRFYLSADKRSSVTIRPSGTSRNLKIYCQLCARPSSLDELIEAKKELKAKADFVMVALARKLGMDW